MKWIRRIQTDVEIPDRNKGQKCFDSGAVKLKSGGPGKVTASVNGKGEHPVEIKVDGDAVVAYCDCDRFMDGKFCQHIWATLVAAESKGDLRRIASMWDPYLEHGLDHDVDLLEDGDEDARDSATYDFTDDEPGFPGRPVSTVERPSPPKIPAWKEHICASTRPAAPIARRILIGSS